MPWNWLPKNRIQADQDLNKEVHSHLELERQERLDDGATAEEAGFAARRAFGNVAATQEAVRTEWGIWMFETIWQDAKFALRSMLNAPGFTLAAAGSLALGIGATTAIFTVVNAVLLQPLPFPQPDRLVNLWEAHPSRDSFRNVVNPANFLDWREHTSSFSAMAAVSPVTANLSGGGEPVALDGLQVSPAYFDVLQVKPARGRSFRSDEGEPRGSSVIIITDDLWRSRFASDGGIIGRRVLVNNAPTEIVGVLPPGFSLPRERVEVFMPVVYRRGPQSERGRFLSVIARLKEGVSLAQAEQDLKRASAQTGVDRPKFNTGWTAAIVPMLDNAVEKVRLPLLVLLASVGLVLLIACANVANLMLVRASGRLREIAIRTAIGASRGRVFQQLMAESLMLALVSSLAGIVIAVVSVRALVASMPPEQAQLPRLAAIHVDGTVLLFAVGLAALTAAVFGIVPALQVSQSNPQVLLQEGAVRTTSASRSLLRKCLVVGEVALSLILLAGAGLMLRSFSRLLSTQSGFETEHVLSMQMFTSPAKYDDDAKRALYFSRLLDSIRATPGVREAGTTHFLPMRNAKSASCFGLAGEPEPIPANSPSADFLVVSPGYFETMSMPLLQGRFFDSRDDFNAASAVVVNSAFAKRYVAGQNPIGARLNVCWTAKNPVEIVGVVGDFRQMQLNKKPEPAIFIDNLQAPTSFANIVVKAEGTPEQITLAVQRAIHNVDPDQPITRVETMDEVMEKSVATPRLQMRLLTIFGVIAVSLSLIGIYGVVAYSVVQRTRELGIRIALGAIPGQIWSLVLREGAVIAGIGIALGLCGALASTRVLRTLLYETEPNDPATLVAVVALVAVFVMAAMMIPARRAARIDPLVALREE